jgi:hypothetical protein
MRIFKLLFKYLGSANFYETPRLTSTDGYMDPFLQAEDGLAVAIGTMKSIVVSWWNSMFG